MELRDIKLSEIDIEDSTYQCRVDLDTSAIEDYKTIDPTEFEEPIELRWKSNGKYAIIAGHHRVRAFQEAGRSSVQAHVYDDLTESDALARSIKSNQAYGVRLTNKDRRQGVEKLLLALARENRFLTTKQIADWTGVSSPTIERYRKELVESGKLKEPSTRTTAAGTERVATNKRAKSAAIDQFVRGAKQLSNKAKAIKPTDWDQIEPAERNGLEAMLRTHFEDIERVMARPKPSSPEHPVVSA